MRVLEVTSLVLKRAVVRRGLSVIAGSLWVYLWLASGGQEIMGDPVTSYLLESSSKMSPHTPLTLGWDLAALLTLEL